MSAPGATALVPTHITDEELETILRTGGHLEYLTNKGWIRVRNLLNAAVHKKQVPLPALDWLQREKPIFFEKQSVAYLKSLPPYQPTGAPVEEGEVTQQVQRDAEDSGSDAYAVKSPPAQKDKRRKKKKKLSSAERERRKQAKGQQEETGAPKDPMSEKEASEPRSDNPSAEETGTNAPAKMKRATEGDDPSEPSGGSSSSSDSAGDEGDGDEPEEDLESEEDPPEQPARKRKMKETALDAEAQKRFAGRPKFTLESLYATGVNKQKYDEKGVPRKPEDYSGFRDQYGNRLTSKSDIPKNYQNKEFLQAIDIFLEVNGQPCYDSEAIALGEITEAEYFLAPDTEELTHCEPRDVLCGLSSFDPQVLITAQVYGLAKQQAGRIGIPKDRRIKWALLRTQAYAAGWYCQQKYTKFATPPKNSITEYIKDIGSNRGLVLAAYKLASFIPFFHEFTFRAQCSTWSPGRSAEFEPKVKKLAESSQLADVLKFTELSDILGSAFRWIGVKRVMDVLQVETERNQIPNVFLIRKRAPPAGQAFITTCAACCNQIATAGWYDALKEHSGYKDDKMMSVAAKLEADPFKYHMMYRAYGRDKISDAEASELFEARSQAEKLAPMAHAYANIFLENYDLANNKVLVKYANNSGATYTRYQKFFQARRQERSNHVTELFCERAFAPLPRRKQGQKRRAQVIDEESGEE